MRIEVVDPSGQGLGTAIGLLELGHNVHYVGSHSSQKRDDVDCMRRQLIAHMFGAQQPANDDCELLVLVDVFADYLHSLHEGFGPVGVDATDPLQDDAGTMIYPMRLQYFCDRAQAATHVAVIDMSDHRDQREVAFEALPNAQLFAREVHGAQEGAWRSFPFLYNLSMLWLEYLQPQGTWLVREDRQTAWDWAFCGTVDHERYAHKRELAIALLGKRWPHLRGAVLGQQSFRDVVIALQSVRFGLDLDGVGEMCFRLHECLALGTPVWRPLSKQVVLPQGLRDVVVRDPEDVRVTEVDAVRAIYAQHYAPRAAAAWLLQRLDFAPDQYSISQATSIAPAASR